MSYKAIQRFKTRIIFLLQAIKYLVTGKLPVIFYRNRGLLTFEELKNSWHSDVTENLQIQKVTSELVNNLIRKGAIKIKRWDDIKHSCRIYEIELPIYKIKQKEINKIHGGK